jgi:hypothetical protein
MAHNRLGTRIVLLAAVVVALPVVLTFFLVLAIIGEHALFGTRYALDAAEGAGLTTFLQALFTGLGING